MADLPLDPDTSSARTARRFITDMLGEWANVDDVELIASELVVNAVHHGSPPLSLTLAVDGDVATVTVVNRGDAEPVLGTASDEDDRGRGLAIVAQLADDWGWRAVDSGIEVWASVRRVDS
jgi:anti-sigma regulatory factor (Ser/Thr protein kinase)